MNFLCIVWVGNIMTPEESFLQGRGSGSGFGSHGTRSPFKKCEDLTNRLFVCFV